MNGRQIRLVACVVGCALTLILIGVTLLLMPKLGNGGPLTGTGNVAPKHHTEEHAPCPDSSLPKFLRDQDIQCVQGSENWFKGDVSKLLHGSFRDSKVYIHNGTRDNRKAKVIAWGCGRHWSLVDKRGPLNSFPGSPNIRDSHCNLRGHITLRQNRYGNYIKNDHASRHHDGGDGSGGGGGGAW